MSQSEVARVRAQIQAEYEAAKRGMEGYAEGSARHDFIRARMDRMGELHEELVEMVGEEQAAEELAQACWSPEEMGTSPAGNQQTTTDLVSESASNISGEQACEMPTRFVRRRRMPPPLLRAARARQRRMMSCASRARTIFVRPLPLYEPPPVYNPFAVPPRRSQRQMRIGKALLCVRNRYFEDGYAAGYQAYHRAASNGLKLTDDTVSEMISSHIDALQTSDHYFSGYILGWLIAMYEDTPNKFPLF